MEQYGWFSENCERGGEKNYNRVGQKLPNSFGLHDMHGNLMEWCYDWHGEYVSGDAMDPTGPSFGEQRVLRGGSWVQSAERCRSAWRCRLYPSFDLCCNGFRVCLSPSGK